MSKSIFDQWRVDLSSADESPSAWYLAWVLYSLGAEPRALGVQLPADALLNRVAELSPRAKVDGRCIICGPAGQRFEVCFTSDTLGSGASDEAAWAWSGMASFTGDEWSAPLCPGAPLGSFCSALYALIPLLLGRLQGAEGISIELDVPAALSTLIEIAGLKFSAEGAIRGRTGDWWGLAGWGIYDCSDARVAIALRDVQQLRVLGRLLGIHEFNSVAFDDFSWGHLLHADEANALIVGALCDRKADDVVEELRRERVAASIIPCLDQLLLDRHLKARGAFELVGDAQVPTWPIRMNSAISTVSSYSHPGSPPLLGLRVVDLSTMWAGPMAARMLADLGAGVVKAVRPKARAGNFSTGQEWDCDFYSILSDRNKQCVSVDLRCPADATWLREELRNADVLIENFAVGALARAGFSLEMLHAINPRLVVVSMPAMGLSGPSSESIGYGSTIEQSAGIGWLYRDGEGNPHRSGINFSDPVAGLFAVAGTLLGLASDRQSCLVELSQQEASLHLMTGALWEFQRTGTFPPPIPALGAEPNWYVPLNQVTKEFVQVRDVAEVVGKPEQPGTPSMSWIPHPDGRSYPLPILPWRGTYSQQIDLRPVTMPNPASEAPHL